MRVGDREAEDAVGDEREGKPLEQEEPSVLRTEVGVLLLVARRVGEVLLCGGFGGTPVDADARSESHGGP